MKGYSSEFFTDNLDAEHDILPCLTKIETVAAAFVTVRLTHYIVLKFLYYMKYRFPSYNFTIRIFDVHTIEEISDCR